MVAFDFLVDSYFCCHIIKFFVVLNLFVVEFIIYINF